MINNIKDLSDDKIDDKKNLLTNFIFLKMATNNIYNACSANHFTQQINIYIMSAIYSKKKQDFSAMPCLSYKHFDHQPHTTTNFSLPYF